jgi:hypothetical protein
MAHIKQLVSSHKSDDVLYEELSKDFKIVNNDHAIMLRYKKNKQKTELQRKTRGIILDKATRDICCYPLEGKISLEDFKKKVEWKDIIIEESIDGTLINMYYYNKKWRISTTSTLDGNCFWNSSKSFKDLFLETFKIYMSTMKQLHKHYTYSFVLCHPDTRNVTVYQKPKLYHILTRDLNTYNEINLNIGIPKPKILKLDDINHIQCNNYDDLLRFCSKIPFTREGIMLYNRNRQYRTKIKGKKHIKVKNIRGNHSNITYTLLECIQSSKNSVKKLLRYYPEYTEQHQTLVKKIDLIKSELLHIYTETKKLKNKQFRYHTKYKRAIKELHNQYIYLIKNYKPSIHKYKPCINEKKVTHFVYKEIDISYMVYLLSTI